MSFSHNYRRLRSGNTQHLHACPELSTHEEQLTVAAKVIEIERDNGTSTSFSPEMVQERIKANLELVLAQISAVA